MGVRTYYERYWTDEGFSPTGALPADLEKLYEAHVQPHHAVIDVGCGDGLTSGPWLTEHAGRYTGLDVSESAIALARSAGLNAVLVEDAASLPLDDGSCDIAVSVEVFEHLFAPDEAAREILRVLRPGGKLIATVPNVGHWKQGVDLVLRGRWDPRGDHHSIDQPWRDPHIRFFTVPALRHMLESCGYQDVQVGGRGGSVAANFRALSRFARNPAGPLGSRLLQRWPGFLGMGLYAVATKP